MRRVTLLFLASAASACTSRLDLTLAPPWSEGQMAIVVVTDEAEQPLLESPAVVHAGETLNLTVVDDRAAFLEAEVYSVDRLAPNGDPFGACTFTFVGGGNLVEAPEQRFRYGPLDDDAPGRGFVRTSTAPARRYPLHHVSCAADRPPRCEQVKVTVIPWTEGERLYAVAAVDDRRAVVAGVPLGGGRTTPMVLGLIDGEVPTLWPAPRHGLHGRSEQLSAAGGIVWGVVAAPSAEDSDLFALDLEGNRQAAPSVQITSTLREIVACADGSVFLAANEQGLFEVSATGTVARTELPIPPRRFAAWSRSRLAAVSNDGSRSLRVWDGRGWNVEWERPVFDGRDLKGVAVDDQQMVASGSGRLVLERSEEDHSWRPLPSPPLGFSDVGPITTWGRGGVVLVGDETGPIAAWSEGRWCQVDAGEERRYVDLSRAPSGRVVYALGEAGPDPEAPRSYLIRLELLSGS